jgi:phage N-6-adenine-methyltransferase
METEITPITKAELALQNANTPKESHEVEALAAAAKAWAKEQNDYEGVVEASRIYILARRKTTELVEPNIYHGPHRWDDRSNDAVTSTLIDYGFTRMQWQRRKKELEISLDEIDDYIDDCIEKQVEPTKAGLLRYVLGPHVSFNSEENEWYTPKGYIEAARRVMGGIDLDPASSDFANQTVKADKYYTMYDDGLSHDWAGRVWMNPPYAAELIGKFTNKLNKHCASGDVSEAIVLVNNATETSWFADLVSVASAVLFPRGRIRFIDQYGQPSGAPLQGQAVVYCGDHPEKFIAEFKEMGWVALICK